MWKTIESAPRDGSYVDLWTDTGGGERLIDCIYRNGRWMYWVPDGFGDGEYEVVPGIASHWMVVPEPPESE